TAVVSACLGRSKSSSVAAALCYAQAIELTTLQNTLVELRLHMQSKDEKIVPLEWQLKKIHIARTAKNADEIHFMKGII
ncbi:MAG TPA: hypothetical protein VI522_07095, partial [Gammaproteobacteria bacterium]|nr:hypothetical protein [Gammaproteobacteria bacterium]